MMPILADLIAPAAPLGGMDPAWAALLLTLAIEVPLTLVLVPRFLYGHPMPAMKSLLIVAILANVFTQPIVYAISGRNPALTPPSEMAAMAIEAAALFTLLGIPWGGAVAISAIANCISWFGGGWIMEGLAR